MKQLYFLFLFLFLAVGIHAQIDTTLHPTPKDSNAHFLDTTKIFTPKDTLVLVQDSSLSEKGLADSLALGTIKASKKIIYGIASFYSKGLDGTKTATGETYRNSKLTAASNNFKLNTWVRVTNMGNEKAVIVRINDRMHPRMAKKGRVVDLSRLAALKLDFIKKGLTKVKVEVVDKNIVD